MVSEASLSSDVATDVQIAAFRAISGWVTAVTWTPWVKKIMEWRREWGFYLCATILRQPWDGSASQHCKTNETNESVECYLLKATLTCSPSGWWPSWLRLSGCCSLAAAGRFESSGSPVAPSPAGTTRQGDIGRCQVSRHTMKTSPKSHGC